MSVRPSRRQRRNLAATTALAVVLSAAWSAAVRAQPQAIAPQVIDGPSPAISSLAGMSVSRDGTGGLVYLKTVAGVAHVFVSSLTNGVFQSPQLLDVGSQFSGSSSQPVIAAGQGGVLLVAFINAGELYVVDRIGSGAPWQPPAAIYANASNPAISLSPDDNKAYLAFTAAQNGGDDVEAEYYDAGLWSAVPGPLNVSAGDNAGTGSGAPVVAAAGDGVGIVAWGESGHLFSRRVWGTAPSVEYEQLDPASVNGWNETAVADPSISVGGDSSYVDVAFDETLQSGGQTQTRVLLTRLIAEQVQATTGADGLSTPGTSNAGQAAVTMNEYGRGFVTAALTPSNELVTDELATNGAPAGVQAVDAGSAGPPYAAPGLAGLTSTLIAWQQNVGATPAIALRYAQNGSSLGATEIVSDPLEGAADAAAGLQAGGDGDGDAVAAWVQGSPGGSSIVADQMFVGPGEPAPPTGLVYSRTPQPTLSWTAAREDWGPLTYTVTVDGQQIGQTEGTSLIVPAGLIDGPHVWQVSATNLAGEQSQGRRATVFVDTTPPRMRFSLTGTPVVGSPVGLSLNPSDAPAPLEPGARASGVGKVAVRWGDGARAASQAGASHSYARAGLYRIKVTVTDRAGNPITIARYLRVLP
jgi:hypothetical protein